MDRQLRRISIHDLLKEISASQAITAEGMQFSIVVSRIAVNIRTNSGRVVAIFRQFPLAIQEHILASLLKRLQKDGDSVVLQEDVFSGESALVTRISGNALNVHLRITH